MTRAIDFFETHPVFRHEEFVAAHTAQGRSVTTSNNLLVKHVATGRLLRIRKGLYATVPRGIESHAAPVDPYLTASRLTEDAVVAYHAALQFHGKAYSVWRRFHCLTAKRARPLTFRDLELVPVQAPPAVRGLPDLGGGVETLRHAGGTVRVTTLERALVDVLDAPERSGGWEEVWRSLEMVEYFDLGAVTRYTAALGSALTAARVGFFLDQHRAALMVEDQDLEGLRALAPAQPRYLDSTRESGRLVPRWNLVVPQRVLERGWEEPL